MAYFHFGDVAYDHEIGNIECPECWSIRLEVCGSCKEGLIHNQFGDENGDCGYWVYHKCDICGETG